MCKQPIINGVPWFDTAGRIVNAHGSCVVRDGDRWFLFGEYKTDAENEFNGFSCYSSPDLVNWTFERMALPVQEKGSRLGPHRVGERVKVMRCPSTGRFVMYAHSDDTKYMDPCVVVAISDQIDGEYELLGPLTCGGEPIRMWDMGTFQDNDGTGYLMTHEGNIYRLSEDYLTAEEEVAHEVAPGGESPAMCHVDDTYFLMLSNKTGWDRNDNYYLTAPTPAGPWTNRGLFCPEGSCTWNSQCSFIFPMELADGRVVQIYTGDRWSYPHQASSASYVWMPMVIEGDTLSIPEYWQAWDPDTCGRVALREGGFLPATLQSDTVGEATELSFEAGEGERVALIGDTGRDGGYADVTITARDGGERITDVPVDFYSPADVSGIVFLSPTLPGGAYDLTVVVRGDNCAARTKNGTPYGSTGYQVRVTGLTPLTAA